MNIEIREYTQDDVKDMIEIWNEIMEKDKEEIIKKHITNMNKFCNENIDFESGKEQLELIYKYYTKRFSILALIGYCCGAGVYMLLFA